MYECVHYHRVWRYSKDPELIAAEGAAEDFLKFLNDNPMTFTFGDAPLNPPADADEEGVW